jgi:hypothetical protein
MQESVSRQNSGSNEAADRISCPYCGQSFACGGTVKKARGGEIYDPILGKKKEARLPSANLNVYRGEDVARGEEDEDMEGRRREMYVRELRRRRRRDR